MKENKSKCCNAPVKVGGGDVREISTRFYVCLQCNKPCDIKPTGNKNDSDLRN